MADARQTYRKLPGRRRGVIFSASLWTWRGSFAFGQVRAVSGAVQKVLLSRYSSHRHYQGSTFCRLDASAGDRCATADCDPDHAPRRLPAAAGWLWLLLAALAAGWIYISAAQTCTCRLYTAVSREDLPSLYRMWTARKALAELEHRISQVQGVFTENWAEAVDLRVLGPAGHANQQAAAGRRPGGARSRTWISDIFLASLFADAVVAFVEIRSPASWLADLSLALTVVQIRERHWDLRAAIPRHSAQRHAEAGDCRVVVYRRHYLCPDDCRRRGCGACRPAPARGHACPSAFRNRAPYV